MGYALALLFLLLGVFFAFEWLVHAFSEALCDTGAPSCTNNRDTVFMLLAVVFALGALMSGTLEWRARRKRG